VTPCKNQTTSCNAYNFILKLCTRDYVGEGTRHANFGVNRYSGSFSPNRRNKSRCSFVTVLSCPCLFSDPTPRSNRWTDFHALCIKRRVSAQRFCPQNSPKIGVTRQHPAQTAKYKNRNISKTINRWT